MVVINGEVDFIYDELELGGIFELTVHNGPFLLVILHGAFLLVFLDEHSPVVIEEVLEVDVDLGEQVH